MRDTVIGLFFTLLPVSVVVGAVALVLGICLIVIDRLRTRRADRIRKEAP